MEQIRSNTITWANALLLHEATGYYQTYILTHANINTRATRPYYPESSISPDSLQNSSKFLRSTIVALDSSVIMINRSQWTVAGFHLWKSAAHQIPLHPTPARKIDFSACEHLCFGWLDPCVNKAKTDSHQQVNVDDMFACAQQIRWFERKGKKKV